MGAEGKDKISFILYKTQKPVFDGLTNEQAGKLIKHIFAYVNCENPKETDDPMVNYGFSMIKSMLEIDLDRWKETSKKRTEAINKRWKDNNSKDTNEYKSIEENTNDTDMKCNDMNCNEMICNENIKENVVSNNTTKEDDTSSQIRSSFFERFWKIYPKKVGKDKCKKWFLNKSRKIDESLIFKIVEAIEKQKTSAQWLKDDGQFIPHPYTWLNRSGWEDELDTSGVHQATSSPIDSSISEDIDLSFLDLELSGDDNSNAN